MQIYFSAEPQSSPKHCHFHYPNSLWGHKKTLIFLEVLKPEMRPWNRNKQKKTKTDPNNRRTSQFQGIPEVKAHCRNATSCISILSISRVPHQVKSIAAIVRKLSVIRRAMPDLTRERIWSHSSWAAGRSPGCAWLPATEPCCWKDPAPCQGLQPTSFLWTLSTETLHATEKRNMWSLLDRICSCRATILISSVHC